MPYCDAVQANRKKAKHASTKALGSQVGCQSSTTTQVSNRAMKERRFQDQKVSCRMFPPNIGGLCSAAVRMCTGISGVAHSVQQSAKWSVQSR
eukprot:3912205-Amphidinium_carterae.1